MPTHSSSPRVRRCSSRLLALAAGPLLICCAASSPASARGNSKKPAALVQVVEIELRESGDAKATHEFVLPVEGQLSGWTEIFAEPRFCRFRTSSGANERSNLRVRCFTRSRSKIPEDLEFEFEAERVLVVDEVTLLGELEERGGRRLQVVATRR